MLNIFDYLKEGYVQLSDVAGYLAEIVDNFVQPFALGCADGSFLYCNKAFCELTGYSRKELKNISWAVGLTPVKWRAELARMFKELRTTGLPQKFEIEYLKKDKTKIPVELLLHRILTDDGNEIYYFFVNDISAKKEKELLLTQHVEKLEGLVREQNNEIAQLDRLHIIGQIAGGIAHEIRNPLTTVRGFLQILSEKDNLAEEKEVFDLIITELDRANSIISEFLSISHNKEVSLEKKNLNTILNVINPLLSADAIKSDKNIIYEQEDVPDLLLDEKEIRQLILNLVRNGLEAMESGKALTVKTYLEKDEVVLLIKDEGPGIPPEILDKLGTPFISTKEKGTGLGLSICYNIAKRHNAYIEVETSSQGTTFYVRFKL